MRTLHSSLLALGTAVIAALGVTACKNVSGTAPAAPLMSQGQADCLATTVIADVADEIATATMDGANGSAMASANASARAGSTTATESMPAKGPTAVTH